MWLLKIKISSTYGLILSQKKEEEKNMEENEKWKK